MAIGTVLYAALMIPFNVLQIPSEGGVIVIRPAIAIPMLFGVLFGPIAGFVIGLLGSILSNFASFGAFSWSREIGSGLLGAVSGIAYFVIKGEEWTKAKALAMVAMLAILASIVGIGFTTMTDYIFQTGLSTIASFYSEAGTDAVNGAILTPLLLYMYAKTTTGHARRT
jgi:energy-coupling factor transport system substrate-specific component